MSDSQANSTGIMTFLKKPPIFIGLAVLILIALYMLFFSGGSGSNPTAVSLRNIVSRQSQAIGLIDDYSNEVRSSRLKSKLSEVSIILTAGSADIGEYISKNIIEEKPSKATVSANPSKVLVQQMEDSQLVNNLDSELKGAIEGLLVVIDSEISKVKSNNSSSKNLNSVLDKVQSDNSEVYRRLTEEI